MVIIEIAKFFIFVFIFPGVIFISLFGFILIGIEEKFYARMQQRSGNRIFQPLYDFIKFSSKGITIPPKSYKYVFIVAPILSMLTTLLLQTYMPIFAKYFIWSYSSDIIFMLILLIFPIICVILAAASSGSRFSGINISRAIVMMISFSIPLIIIFITVIYKVNILNKDNLILTLKGIYDYQIKNGPLAINLSMIPALIAFLMIIPAVLGIAPFDIYDSNTEISGGISSVFSGFLLGVVKFTKAIHFVIIASLFVTTFFTFSVSSIEILNIIIFYILVIVVILLSVSFVKAITARIKIEQAVNFLIKIPTALSIISLILVYFRL